MTPFKQALKITVQNSPDEALRVRGPMLGPGPIGVSERELGSTFEASLASTEEAPIEQVSSFPRPDWTPDISENLFLNELPESIASERFRSLRTRLLRMREGRPLQTIILVSASAGEGKSVVAANLSQVLAAHASERVLLIDGDLRLPRLHSLLGAPASPGLHECLSGEVKHTASIQQSPMDGLYFLPAGNCDARSAGLLGGSAFADLLTQLRREFGWIVIDSPAALAVSDAAALAEYCDGVVVVARSGVAKQHDLKLVCEQFEPSKILGLVLNGKRLEKKDTYAYGESSREKRTRGSSRSK